MVMFHLHEEGVLPQSQFHVVRNDLLSILGSAGGRAFWRIAEPAYDPAFGHFVADSLATGKKPYDMLRDTRM